MDRHDSGLCYSLNIIRSKGSVPLELRYLSSSIKLLKALPKEIKTKT